MVNDMIELELLLDQYDPETLLVGPLLGLSLSSGYRYFHIAGKGTKIYHALGLGFVDSEAEAEHQRAEAIQKLMARFAEVRLFDSHTEMARAVHARWPSDETARVLSSAEIAINKAAPADFPDQQAAIEASTEGSVPGSDRLVDALARGLSDHVRAIQNPAGSAPDLMAMNHFVAPESNWHFGLAQSAAVVAGEATPSVLAVQESAGSNHETELTNHDDLFASALARKLFNVASPDHDAKPTAFLDQATTAQTTSQTTAHGSPDRRVPVEPTATPEAVQTADQEAPNDLGKADQSSGHHDKIPDNLARELAEPSGKPARLPLVAMLPPLITRQAEPTGRQQPVFGLSDDDDLASAVLKLRAALDLKSLPNPPSEPRRDHPDGAVVTPIKDTPGRTSIIVRFAAVAATTLLGVTLVLPDTRQGVQELMSLVSPPLSNSARIDPRSGPAAPAMAELADAANPPQQGQIAPGSDVSLPMEAPANDATSVAGSSQETTAAMPEIKPSSPVAQPSPSTNGQTELADAANPPQRGQTAPATPGVVPSSPAAQPSPPANLQTKLADAAHSLQQGETTSRSDASLPGASASEGPASDVTGVTGSGRETTAATLGVMPSSPAAQPSPPTNHQTELADAANPVQQVQTAAATPGLMPSSPAAQPSPPTNVQAKLADAANPPQQGQTTPRSGASLPETSASEWPASDVTGVAGSGRGSTAATPGVMPSSPAAQPSPSTDVQTKLADGANPPRQGVTTPHLGASLPSAPASEAPASDVTGAADAGPEASAATPGTMPPSPPAAHPSPPADIHTNTVPAANQELATAAPSTVASAPTALPSVVKSSNVATVSRQQPSAVDDAPAADRPDAQTIAQLVGRGMQSLNSGDFESARLSLRRAVEAIPDSAATPSVAGHEVNGTAPVQEGSPTTKRPSPALLAPGSEPPQSPAFVPAPPASVNSSRESRVARLEVQAAPGTAPTPLPSAAPGADQSAPIATPSGRTTPASATAPVLGPKQPSTSDVATRDSGPAPIARPTKSASEPETSLHIKQDEITTLLKRGVDFLRNGDLVSARLVLRRAAEGGNAEAALALGSTYDPFVLRQLRAVGIAPDVARARQWYQKAAALGASAAQQRLAKLAESGQ